MVRYDFDSFKAENPVPAIPEKAGIQYFYPVIPAKAGLQNIFTVILSEAKNLGGGVKGKTGFSSQVQEHCY